MASEKILLIEENEKRRSHITRFLNGLAVNVVPSSSFAEAFKRLQTGNSYSLIVMNFSPLDSKSIKILQHLKKIKPQPSTVVLSNDPDHKLAISLINQNF